MWWSQLENYYQLFILHVFFKLGKHDQLPESKRFSLRFNMRRNDATLLIVLNVSLTGLRRTIQVENRDQRSSILLLKQVTFFCVVGESQWESLNSSTVIPHLLHFVRELFSMSNKGECAIGEVYHTSIIPFHIWHLSNMCSESGMSKYDSEKCFYKKIRESPQIWICNKWYCTYLLILIIFTKDLSPWTISDEQ